MSNGADTFSLRRWSESFRFHAFSALAITLGSVPMLLMYAQGLPPVAQAALAFVFFPLAIICGFRALRHRSKKGELRGREFWIVTGLYCAAFGVLLTRAALLVAYHH